MHNAPDGPAELHSDEHYESIRPELDDVPMPSFLIDINGTTVLLKDTDRRVAISRALERLPDEVVYANDDLTITCTRFEAQPQ